MRKISFKYVNVTEFNKQMLFIIFLIEFFQFSNFILTYYFYSIFLIQNEIKCVVS